VCESRVSNTDEFSSCWVGMGSDDDDTDAQALANLEKTSSLILVRSSNLSFTFKYGGQTTVSPSEYIA